MIKILLCEEDFRLLVRGETVELTAVGKQGYTGPEKVLIILSDIGYERIATIVVEEYRRSTNPTNGDPHS